MEQEQPQDFKIWTIPNLLTCLNLASGAIATVCVFEGSLLIAAALVFVAALFDFLDGMSARALKSFSPLGKDLDSLADMVSFGLLPGVLSFSLLKLSLYGDTLPLTYKLVRADHYLYLGTALLIPVFSALRLAKFNIDTRQSESFIGLPTPANAIFFASLIIVNAMSLFPTIQLILKPSVLAGFNIVMSLLLISEIPMFSLKFKSLKWHDNKLRFCFLILALIMLLILQWYALPLIILTYILISFFLYLSGTGQ
ncbi:MAG: CDP-alcohol phosphatidyltransferase family protein [Bacteroidota bacterium]|nr:CDP-alcohol phosphatidyltransferase family protein [Bacteroidota bacterium]